MSSKGSQKAVYAVALFLLVAGLGYLIVSGFQQNSVYFLNVSEVLAMDTAAVKQARLFGTVAERDLQVDKGAFGAKFLLEDKDDKSKTLAVEYKGVVPDTFKPGVEVIIEGGMAPGGASFAASSLMTKCPSKYQKENREQG